MKRRWITRRDILCTGAAAVAHGATKGLLSSQAASTLADDPRRPQFHLLPIRNWMNDPNGPIYFNGKYHMFFQYNPESAVWGNMSWNHAISEDMVHWVNYPVAFTTTPGGADAAGCFSGSTIVKDFDGRPRVYALYTGVIRDKANETIRNEGLRESQCLAWSDDPLLRNWKKLDKPVIPDPPAGMKVVGFRDPAVWKDGEIYYMTIGSGIEQRGGCLLLYRSTDLHTWQYMHIVAEGEWNGKPTSNPVDDGEMWECPEIFKLGDQHVLIYSTLRKVFWQSGFLDREKLTFKARKTGVLDTGSFYAPKTQLDKQGARILWGWIPEKRSEDEMMKAGWSGMLSLPRVLNLGAEGNLRMSFSPRLKVLRSRPLAVRTSRSEVATSIPGATGELLCQGPKNLAWRLEIHLPGAEPLSIRYDPARSAFIADGNEMLLQSGDLASVHAFIDGSVIEILIAERVGLTRRFYYEGPTAPDISCRMDGSSVQLRAWGISPISHDRLTSGRS